MTLTFTVTLERRTGAPVTVRGDCSVDSPVSAARQALRCAERAYPHFKWDSFCLVVERAKLAEIGNIDATLPGILGSGRRRRR